MRPIISYLWNVNKKTYIVTSLIFLFIEVILFSQMIVKKSNEAVVKQQVVFVIIMATFIVYVLYMFWKTMKSYSRLLTNLMLRVTAISGKQYVGAMFIFFFSLMVLWHGICGMLCYVGYVLLLPDSELYIYINEIVKIDTLSNFMYTINNLFEFLFITLQILLIITLVKLLTKKKKIQSILVAVIFLIINISIILVSTLLGNLVPVLKGWQRIEYHNENQQYLISIYQSHGFNIFNMAFMIILGVLMFYLIAYIIDKKLEI